jgi:hypothetical protein
MLTKIDHRRFEEMVAVLLGDVGFELVTLTPNGPDGGVDIIVEHQDSTGVSATVLIECKHWLVRSKPSIGVAATLQAARHRLGASTAVLLSSTGFAPRLVEMKAELATHDLLLADSDDLAQWVRAWERTFGSPARYQLDPMSLLGFQTRTL